MLVPNPQDLLRQLVGDGGGSALDAIVARAAIAAALDPVPGAVRYEAADLFRLGGAGPAHD